MLIAQHAVYLETRVQEARHAGDTDEAIRFAKMRDIVFLRLRQNPSEVAAYNAWAGDMLCVETMPVGSPRVASGSAQ